MMKNIDVERNKKEVRSKMAVQEDPECTFSHRHTKYIPIHRTIIPEEQLEGTN